MKFITTLTLLATLATTQGFTAPTPKPCTTSTALQVSRREALSTFGALVVAAPTAANAIAACPSGSNNCVRQTWTPPASISSADAISQLRDAIGSYPQGGQDGGKIDGGGYTLITDNLDASGGLVYEFRSSGKGTFAKLFNGGKPFVDDLIVEPNGSAFEFRSSSRVGDSDFGVNKARLAFIGNLLQEKGWTGA